MALFTVSGSFVVEADSAEEAMDFVTQGTDSYDADVVEGSFETEPDEDADPDEDAADDSDEFGPDDVDAKDEVDDEDEDGAFFNEPISDDDSTATK